MTTAGPKSDAPIPRPLTGQKALVTGASSGIGRAVAIALGQAGADMTLTQWNTVISVNLTGQFLCARAAILEFPAPGSAS